MAFLYRPRSYKQPNGPAALDPNNPLTTGIVCCIPFTEGFGKPRDIVPGSDRRVDAGSTSWTTGPSGTLANSWSYANATTTDLGFTSGAFTIAAYFNATNIVTTNNIITRSSYTSESVNDGWVLQLNSTGFASFAVFKNNAGAVYEIDCVTAQTLGDHTIIGTSDGSNMRQLFWDGRFEASKTGNASPGADSTGTFSVNTTSVCPSYLVVIWNRVLSLQEVQQWHRNPWQILQGGQSAKLSFGNVSATGTATGTSTAAAIGYPLTWNPAKTDTTLALSNGNLTATKISGNAQNAMVMGVQTATNGLYYFESVATFATSGNTDIGIAANTATFQGQWVGQASNTVGYYSDGTVYSNNALVTTLATYATGNNVSVAVDLNNHLIWWRVNGGSWNNNVSNNPTTGVGGVTIPAAVYAAPVVPAATLFQFTGTADVVTIGLLQSSWTYTAPVGFGVFQTANQAASPATATGTSTSSVIGSSEDRSVAAATGAESDSYIGSSEDRSVAAATGTETDSYIGSSQAASPATTTGTSTATGIAGEIAAAIGTSTADGIGSSQAASPATATGSESDSYVGSAQDRSVATVTGGETDSYIGSAQDRSVATATGSETDSFIGSAQDRSVATATGTSTADGNNGFKATATGTSATAFVGASQDNSVATVTASATATAVGSSQSNGVATATASASAAAVGNSTDRSVAVATGTAAVSGTSLRTGSTASATGSAAVVGAASSYFSFFSRANAKAEGVSVVRATGDKVHRLIPKMIWVSIT